jgi:2-(1,2-epoxy-1,2-dihydrophenyl)acetyl-CoA isomerase
MDLHCIRADVADDGVATLTLARPEAGNGIDLALARELNDVTTAWSVDRRVRAVLLRAEGANFCVGGDLKSFRDRDDLPAHLTDVTTYFHAAISRLARVDAPVVTAVQGSAAGGGLSLALAGDLVLAGASSRFVVAYTAIGFTPDGGSTWILPRLVGLRRALDLALTNRRLTAAEAVAEGLVTTVVPDEALADEALALARSLAAGPTGALGGAKRLLRGSLERDFEHQLLLETESLAAASGSPDGREGVAAFLAKRAPQFHGQERW